MYPTQHRTLKNNTHSHHFAPQSVYQSVLEQEKHDDLVKSGDRRMSHQAIKGAMMIFLYR